MNSQMDPDDVNGHAHELMSLGDETQSEHDNDQEEELSAHVKRTKLDTVDDPPAKVRGYHRILSLDLTGR
jgi:hypothetical protein